MQPATKSIEKKGTHRQPESTPEHDALIREVAEDARQEPERFLQDSIVKEGGE